MPLNCEFILSSLKSSVLGEPEYDLSITLLTVSISPKTITKKNVNIYLYY